MPRSANTGSPRLRTSHQQDDQDREREEEASEEEPSKTASPPVARAAPELAGGRSWRETVDHRATSRRLVPLTRPADNDVADQVQDEGDEEQQEAQEEQALERGVAARHLVAPGRERSHRRGDRLAGIERVGGELRAPEPPAATATTIVSPIAREMPRMTAATMPDRAAGKTTRTDVVMRRAPSPNEASRGASGTARIASSLIEAIERDGQHPDPDACGQRG